MGLGVAVGNGVYVGIGVGVGIVVGVAAGGFGVVDFSLTATDWLESI